MAKQSPLWIAPTITEATDIVKFYQWLEKAELKGSTEALIIAAQALSTRSIETRTYHRQQGPRQDSRCKLCNLHPSKQSNT